VRRLKVWVDKERCVSSQSCITIAPKAFVLDADGSSFAATPEAELPETLREAAAMCPTGAIVIEVVEKDNEQPGAAG
jgi:ferredoxin